MVAGNNERATSYHGRAETPTRRSDNKASSRRRRRQTDDDGEEIGRKRVSSSSKRRSRRRERSTSPVKHSNVNKHSGHERTRSRPRSRHHTKKHEDKNKRSKVRSRRSRSMRSKSRDHKTHRNYEAAILNQDTFDAELSSQSSTWRTDPSLWVAEKIISWCISGQVRIQRMNGVVQRASCSTRRDEVRDDEEEVAFQEAKPRSNSKESSLSTKARTKPENKDKAASAQSQVGEKRSTKYIIEAEGNHYDVVPCKEIEIRNTQPKESELGHSASNQDSLEIKKKSMRSRSRSLSKRYLKRFRSHSPSKRRRSLLGNDAERVLSSQYDTVGEGGQSPQIETRDPPEKNSTAAPSQVVENESTKDHVGVQPPLLEIGRISSKKFHRKRSHSSQTWQSTSIPGTVIAAKVRDEDDISALSYLIPGRWKLFKNLRKGPPVPPIEEDDEDYIVPVLGMLGHSVNEKLAKLESKPNNGLENSMVRDPVTVNSGGMRDDAMVAKNMCENADITTEQSRLTIVSGAADKTLAKESKTTKKDISADKSFTATAPNNKSPSKETNVPPRSSISGKGHSKVALMGDPMVVGEADSVPEEQGFEISF